MESLSACSASMVSMLNSRNRGRECLELLRRFYRLVLLNGANSNEVSSEVRSLLFKATQDQKAPRKIVSFFQYLLALLTRGANGDPSFLRVDLAQSYEPWLASLLGPLLVQCGSVASCKKNLASLVAWAAVPAVAVEDGSATETVPILQIQAAFRGMLVMAQLERGALQYSAHIRAFEAHLIRVLARAAKVSKLKGGGFFKLGASTQAPTLEIDGKPTTELFTAMSASFDYSHDQLLNVEAFCCIRMWLSEVYVRPPSQKEDLLTRKLDPILKDCVVDYCLRVLAQARLPVAEDPGARSSAVLRHNSGKQIAALCLNEALRVLDTICTLDSSLVPRVFPLVRAAAPVASLEGLEFLLHHTPVSSDCDSLFRIFFSGLALDDPLAAFSVLTFCVRNKDVLRTKTSVFVSFFPSFLKLLAWHPLSLLGLVSDLIPSMVSSRTFLELVHNVLDLPLVAAALEDEDERNDSESLDAESTVLSSSTALQSGANVDDMSSAEPFRVISSLLLRSESGTPYALWDGDAPLVQSFCASKTVSARVLAVAKATPVLLGALCDVLLASSLADENLEQLLRVLFGRMNKLFPLPEFQAEIRSVLENKVLAVFHRSPAFVVSLKSLIVPVISSAVAATELTLNLCWIVGEHSHVCTDAAVLREYHEVMELYAYEQLSLAKADAADFVFQSRLMLTLVSCLAKMAARQQHLVARVVLCFSKILGTSGCFHDSVYTRVRECMSLLSSPALALVLLGRPNTYPASENRYDEYSSFEMLRKCRVVECSTVASL